jgi:hypothetical protein
MRSRDGRRGGFPAVLLAATLFAITACDSGPSGPGAFTGTMDQTTTAVGAVVLEVTGPGIQGFSPAGSTRLFHRRIGEEERFRVVLVNTAPGALAFRVDVRDVSAGAPQAVVIEAADEENRILTNPGSLVVRFAR